MKKAALGVPCIYVAYGSFYYFPQLNKIYN